VIVVSRTKLKDRTLPDYTKGEELFNMISHIVGGAFAIAALVLCVVTAATKGSAWGVVGGAIYGATMILLYTMSSIYHGLRPVMAKKVFQVIDHCTIYFLIAGTYTPIVLAALRPRHPVYAWVIFGVVWACAAVAVTLTAIDLRRYRVFSMICYLAMGWCIILFIRPTLEVLPTNGIVLLIAGGVAYTVGAILYGLGKHHRYMHSIFHLFVLAGSILHFFMILFYVMPVKG
jgi:hemolysin III